MEKFESVLEEIKLIVIRGDEAQKTILKNIETILKDIDRIKEDLSDHQNTITRNSIDNNYMKETIETMKIESGKAIDNVWENIRKNRTERDEICKNHASEFFRNIEDANKKVSMSIKIWIGGLILGFLLSILGSVFYAGSLSQRIQNIEQDKGRWNK